RRPRVTPQRAPATPLPEPGTIAVDSALTRHWAGRLARLWTARPAYLPAETATDAAVYVDHAPIGTHVRIQQMYRTGPYHADLRALATPERAPELWLVAPWYALNPQP